MTPERLFASAMRMDDATWRRHANPWSVWTCATVLPVIIFAVWSRVWIGRWYLVLVALSVLWIWLNPRVFGEPKISRHWASRGVLGERIWLNRNQVPVPEHHRRAPAILHTITVVGTVLVVWGLVRLAFWPTVLGTVMVFCGKLWFLDRMVWLHRDMQDTPEYWRWLY